MMGRALATWTRPYQALSTMTVFVVSMVGNSEQMFTAWSWVDIGTLRSEAPVHPTLRASEEVRRVTVDKRGQVIMRESQDDNHS